MSPIWQPPAAGGGGAVATDVIWDTKGDIAAATGADAAVKVAKGADGLFLVADSASSAGVKWGSKLVEHVERTSNITLTGTTSGTANTILTAAAFTPNGTDAYFFEFFCCNAIMSATFNMLILLYEDGTLLNIPVAITAPTGSVNYPIYGAVRYVPTNASHTYVIKGFSTSGAGVLTGGAGNAGDYEPIFFRITRDV